MADIAIVDRKGVCGCEQRQGRVAAENFRDDADPVSGLERFAEGDGPYSLIAQDECAPE
ncbi:hypothetical protein [Martelella soudanensis]|uniref:hypothetical protein n=1 Tax=Martelella sp. NC18 TaxID=2740297 RepID=UPI0015DF7E5D|nr:hypothetical protein [Martelella sp. NC18]